MLKFEDIVFKPDDHHPSYLSYFEYNDDVFTYTATISDPHIPQEWEKDYPTLYTKYVAYLYAAPLSGGGFNQVAYFKGDSKEDVLDEIKKVILYYFIDEV